MIPHLNFVSCIRLILNEAGIYFSLENFTSRAQITLLLIGLTVLAKIPENLYNVLEIWKIISKIAKIYVIFEYFWPIF